MPKVSSGQNSGNSGSSDSGYPTSDPEAEGYDDDQAKEIRDHEKGVKEFYDDMAAEIAEED